MKKALLIVISTIFCNTLFAQSTDGYWDKERASFQEVSLCADCRTWVRTDELPIGTTEIIFRITLLDDNQKLADDLSSLLSSIPDPSGISQGYAGAVSLMSRVAGSDKCKFTIFSSYEDADNYHKTGNYQTGCYIHPNDINRYAARMPLNNSNCLEISTRYLWFGLRSQNLIMNERIVVEVVPWVDNKLSRGWYKEVKEKFFELCVETAREEFTQPDEVCQCVLDKLQQDYKVQDLGQLTEQEIENITQKFGEDCLDETGETESQIDIQREKATSLATIEEYGQAISVLLEIIDSDYAEAVDYNDLGYYYILTKQYLKAIKYLKEGELLDETDLFIKGNLAHAYLLNNDVDLAKSIYTKYKSQNIDEDYSWVEMVEKDFETFNQIGLPSDNFENILSILK